MSRGRTWGRMTRRMICQVFPRQGLRLDDLLPGQLLHPLLQVPNDHRGYAEDDQHHLGQLLEPEDDEQDGQ